MIESDPDGTGIEAGANDDPVPGHAGGEVRPSDESEPGRAGGEVGPSEKPAEDGRRSWGTGDIVTVLSVFTGTVVALLFYLGWVRNSILSNDLGYSESLFTRSTQDYVLRSAPTTFRLALILAVAVTSYAVVVSILTRLRRASRALGLLQVITYVTRGLGLVLLLALGVQLAVSRPILTIPPMAILITGFLVLAGDSIADRSRPGYPVRTYLIGGLLLAAIALFGEATDLARSDGHTLAAQLAEDPRSQATPVLVYAEQSLDINGPGVSMLAIAGDDHQYHFRYSGLLLYQHNDGRYFLIPAGWRAARLPTVVPLIILPDTNAIRIEADSG